MRFGFALRAADKTKPIPAQRAILPVLAVKGGHASVSKGMAHPVQAAFEASDAALTRRVLKRLEALGPMGCIAAQLFRAQKASSRAKKHRGDYVDYAYGRKGDCLEQLCALLSTQSDLLWGWGIDDDVGGFKPQHILYIDLPKGQASFHSVDPIRRSGLWRQVGRQT